MAKLKPLPQRRIITILQDNGFEKIREGKHITFKKIMDDGRILTTWVPRHSEVTIFVIQYIIKQTEIPREEFES